NSNDAVMNFDFDGRIRAWNASATRIYGYTEAEALKMNAAALLPPDPPDDFKTPLQQLREHEHVPIRDTRHVRKGGAELDVALTLVLVNDEAGRPALITAVARDISPQKVAEAEVHSLN